MSVTIKPHPSVSLPLLIPDLGYPIASAGGVVLEDADEIDAAQNSDNLATLLTNDAYGVGSSTLRLNDGLTDIPQEQTLAFLAAANLSEGLDTLTKILAEDAFLEITRTGGRISSVVAWTDVLKTTRIREVTVTYVTGRVATVVEEQFNPGGALLRTLTQTIGYSGGLIASITSEVS